ncbi:MAG: copper amine oxidase N-terminal domain-containing protein [Peptococcaceae bacterium]|nr:MAG: copper amine oxidase N-terminal domain-containing protein [Peptococcaceae bacterium]
MKELWLFKKEEVDLVIKARKKHFALLTLLIFLLTLIPMGSMALAAGYSVLSPTTVDDDTVAGLGTLFGSFTAGALKDGDIVTLSLPNDFQFRNPDGTVMKTADWAVTKEGDSYKLGNDKNYILLPKQVGSDDNGVYDAIEKEELVPVVTQLSENEIKIELNGDPTAGMECFFYLYMGRIYIDAGFEGTINLTADSPSGSGFGSGALPVGKVISGGGSVTISATNVPSFSNDTTDDPIKIRIKEDVAGAIEDGDESIKLVLPDGFEWMDWKIITIYGDPDLKEELDEGGLKISADGDELIFNLPNNFATDSATQIELVLNIQVADETEAETGDVAVSVRGDSDATPSSLVIAKYGEYDANIKAASAPEIVAGMLEQEIGKININEAVAGSLTAGRTILLTLPANAKWGKVDEDSDNNVDLEFVGLPGTDGHVAKWKVTGESKNDAAELLLEKMEVSLEPGVTGDLVIKVSGTAGLSGEITVGKIITPISIKPESTPNVIIGLGNQPAGNLTITETAAGSIIEDEDMILDLPDGVKFANVPTVEVTSGDLDIDFNSIKRQNNDNQLVIPIDGDSGTASTIKVSGINYILDRTVPEGPITVKVQGGAVAEVNDEEAIMDSYDVDEDKDMAALKDTLGVGDAAADFEVDQVGSAYALWPQTLTAAKTNNANCVTPAPPDTKSTCVFKIGDTNYTVGGDVYETKQMDVAPYIKDSRTYLPVRYVAYCLGLTDANIIWDDANDTVTLIKSGTVVQLKIGSTTLLVNGAAITMDVAPEIVDPGRTMLPIRFVAEAFGAVVTWNETAQTVKIEI